MTYAIVCPPSRGICPLSRATQPRSYTFDFLPLSIFLSSISNSYLIINKKKVKSKKYGIVSAYRAGMRTRVAALAKTKSHQVDFLPYNRMKKMDCKPGMTEAKDESRKLKVNRYAEYISSSKCRCASGD